jgi:hypothetical protein
MREGRALPDGALHDAAQLDNVLVALGRYGPYERRACELAGQVPPVDAPKHFSGTDGEHRQVTLQVVEAQVLGPHELRHAPSVGRDRQVVVPGVELEPCRHLEGRIEHRSLTVVVNPEQPTCLSGGEAAEGGIEAKGANGRNGDHDHHGYLPDARGARFRRLTG